jgi:branched-chain amino acid transport system ATP-binding protein
MNSDSSVVSAHRPASTGGALDVSGVTVRFGGLTALDDVSLTAVPCQVTGIIGPNGAGKTTLLNVLCGFIQPQAGTIHFDGKQLSRLRPHKLARLGIARTLQGSTLFAGMTVAENVMLGAASRKRTNFWSAFVAAPWADAEERGLRERSLTALDRLGMADSADEHPAALAHGPRKRVAMARALAAEPRLLLLDEPASGLNESELPGLGELITDVARDTSVVVIEHRMDLMMSICEQIFVLDFGKVISSGTPAQVQSDPAVTAAYLGEAESGAADKTTAGPPGTAGSPVTVRGSENGARGGPATPPGNTAPGNTPPGNTPEDSTQAIDSIWKADSPDE